MITFNVQGQWVQQTSGITQTLCSGYFISKDTGFVGGYGSISSTLLKTTDGGNTYTSIATPSLFSIQSMWFFNKDTGYILNGSTQLYYTTNGGTSWSFKRSLGIYSTGEYGPTSLYFVNRNVGFAITFQGSGKIYRTLNGGLIWDSISIPSNGYYKIHFINSNMGFVSTSSGQIMKTTNGGTTWTQVAQPTGNALYNVVFLNQDTGFAVGSLGNYILKSVDGGVNWTSVFVGSSLTTAKHIVFIANKAYLIGNGIYVSSDRGNTWAQMGTNPTTSSLTEGTFPNDSIGYAVGSGGKIYKTFPGAIAPPTTASSSLYTSSITNTSMTVNWTSGNGARRMVIARATNNSMSNPTTGTSYTANSIFGSGNTVGSGNYVVYDGTGSSCSVTGLSLSTTYFFRVYEYNGTGTTTNYLTTSYASGGTATLPVNWLNFSAELKNENNVQLNWSTASEINNSHFEIERSSDNSNWTAVNTVKGNGNTNTISKYNYTDILTTTKTNKFYYRLKQVDFDGKFEYSKTVGVSVDRPQTNNFYLFYPNPNNGQFTIDFYDNREIKIIRLFDALGKIVKEITTADTKTFIEANQLDKGIYLINVQSNGDNYYSKIVIN